MEQRINLYRFQTGACIHGYRKPWHEGEKKLPDCTCPIVAEGRLRNELDPKTRKPVRILHRSLGKKGNPVRDWDEARAIRDLWLGRPGSFGNSGSGLKSREVSFRARSSVG